MRTHSSLFAGGEADALLRALDRSLAIVEFDTGGKILSANENFCRLTGYGISEIRGRHHSLFVDPGYAQSGQYAEFWRKLTDGQFETGEYLQIGKGGRNVWVQASYTPVHDRRGRISKVVEIATDITREKTRNGEFECKLEALSRVQAVIEFTPEGEILTANENFLKVMGYSLDEIVGRHHRLFVDHEYASSSEYIEFWQKLNMGEFIAAEFRRVAKGGRDVWIQASYNPVFDLSGRVAKIVKFATDVTERVRAVTEIGQGLAQLADNNLEHRIETAFGPAFEPLRKDFNASLERLEAALGQVARSAASVQGGALEISVSSDDLSRRTEQQAASLEETAAALDQVTATVARSAEGASQATSTASSASADAVRSGAVMDEAVVAMGEIEKSSKQIGQIIGVIDEIAFQTNLLALNAGVEAARAGDAGKGFAVVASEVRALAQRSAEAAKEIKGLIAASATQVERGVKLVGDTGRALNGIVSKVAEIDALIAAMAQSSQEQATGLSQVNTAINQMDQTTQQNAAMVEQATAAAANLRAEADALAQMISQFRIRGAGAPRRAAPASNTHAARAAPERRLAAPGARPMAAARSVAQARLAPAQALAMEEDPQGWEEF